MEQSRKIDMLKVLDCERKIKPVIEEASKVDPVPIAEVNTIFEGETSELQTTLKTIGTVREAKAQPVPKQPESKAKAQPVPKQPESKGTPLLEGKFERKTTISLNGPRGIAIGGKGSDMIIAIVECGAHRVQIFRWNDLRVLRVIGTGKRGNGSQEFNCPCGGVVIQGEEIFVSDYNNHRVQVFNVHNGSYCRTIGGDSSKLSYPVGLAIRGDELFVIEYGNKRISVWNHKNGTILRQWGKEGKGDSEFAFTPYSFLCLAPNGELLVSDSNNHVVKVFNPNNGQFIRKFGGGDQLQYPSGITVSNSHVYIAEGEKSRIVVYSLSGEFIKTWGSKGKGDGEFDSPRGILFVNDQLVVANREGKQNVQWFL